MCGGHGSRLDADTEKPLFEVGGRPMVDRVLGALADSGVETVHAAASPNAPATRRALGDRPVDCIDTPGEGYVEDLQVALDVLGGPVLTVAADLPLLDSAAVDRVLGRHDGGSLGVYTPAGIKRALGLSYDLAVERGGHELVPTGINIAGGGDETTHVTYDVRFAVNVNRLEDARVAEVML